ncbi:helix-turn-helix transcriptional regulator [Vitreoscilla stercoraria]|uniref:Helix-turn-helix domain-containing protein n=1 Tax=Vitreoscilla stercoraria TaxID=61 RepID=A0ABY4EB83_VITST|nr:helix-turn-helix domain-containing protein [Vitreoscilla stercoraria]UOO92669.1 helix-turn-helix domain-containing protein [Vitreoscilla stercoraria]
MLPTQNQSLPNNQHLDDIHTLWAKPKVKEVLGIADTKLYQLIKEGELSKPLKIGRRSLWRKSDVLAFIDAKASSLQG